MSYEVIVVGAGPAGSTCAALCAEAGFRTLLVDRSRFPREKVCGDCLNPSAWGVLSRLGVDDKVRAQPHVALTSVRMVARSGRRTEFPLPTGVDGEIAIKRSLLDQVLVDIAVQRGVEFRDAQPVTEIFEGWKVRIGSSIEDARYLVAADGRNSTVARLTGLYPRTPRDRVAWQTHLPAPATLGTSVEMRFHPRGYSGLAPVNSEQANLCLVSQPAHADALKTWAQDEFHLTKDHSWQTIAPLSRPSIHPVSRNLLLIGDAAEVVEPFTGEGIYYALASGELAAIHLLREDLPGFAEAHARLYHGRRWINELARLFCLFPRLSDVVLRLPWLAAALTRKITTRV